MCLITRSLGHLPATSTRSLRRLTSVAVTVDAVSISSCIGPTVINDPARVPEHEFLTVSTSVKIILADLGSNVLLSPAVLTLLVDWDQYFTVLIIQSLVVTPRLLNSPKNKTQGSRTNSFQVFQTHGLDLRLVGLILISEILCLGLRQFSRCRWLPDSKHCVPFFSTCLVSTCVKTSPAVGTALLCSRVLVSLPWLFCSRVLQSLPWLFLFLHAHLARVSTSLQCTPWSENQRCSRSLQT